MWLFTRHGFYSIACASKPDGTLDRENLMVRARRRSHLELLQTRFASLTGVGVVTLPRRDYRYRLIVPKRVWTDIVAELDTMGCTQAGYPIPPTRCVAVG